MRLTSAAPVLSLAELPEEISSALRTEFSSARLADLGISICLDLVLALVLGKAAVLVLELAAVLTAEEVVLGKTGSLEQLPSEQAPEAAVEEADHFPLLQPASLHLYL